MTLQSVIEWWIHASQLWKLKQRMDDTFCQADDDQSQMWFSSNESDLLSITVRFKQPRVHDYLLCYRNKVWIWELSWGGWLQLQFMRIVWCLVFNGCIVYHVHHLHFLISTTRKGGPKYWKNVNYNLMKMKLLKQHCECNTTVDSCTCVFVLIILHMIKN